MSSKIPVASLYTEATLVPVDAVPLETWSRAAPVDCCCLATCELAVEPAAKNPAGVPLGRSCSELTLVWLIWPPLGPTETLRGAPEALKRYSPIGLEAALKLKTAYIGIPIVLVISC